MDYVAIALGVLKLVNWFLDKAKATEQWNAGHDAAVLDASKELLAKTATGKKLVELVDHMDDAALDGLLSDLASLSTGKQ